MVHDGAARHYTAGTGERLGKKRKLFGELFGVTPKRELRGSLSQKALERVGEM